MSTGNSKNIEKSRWIIAIGLAWTFYFIAVLLKTGYISDDAYNSQVSGTLLLTDRTIWDFTFGECMAWIKGAGRFMPGAFYSYPLFHYLDSLFLYKLLTVCVTLANVSLFSYLVYLITRSRAMASLVLFVMPVFFQFRAWHDPFLGFAFLVPLVGIHLFTSLIFFQKFLADRRAWFGGLSVFFWMLALLTYEMSYLCLVCFVFLAFHHERKVTAVLRRIWPHLLVWTVIASISILLRTSLNPHYRNNYPGATLHFNGKAWETFLIQAYAAFPLSYYWRVKTHVRQYLGFFDFFLILGLAAVVFALIRAVREKIPAGLLFLIGLFLVMAPAGIMGVSGYQDLLREAGFGFGYLAVYLQYYGMCAAVLGLFFLVYRKIRGERGQKTAAGVFAALVALTAFYNLGQNRGVALESNKSHKYPRQVLDTALRDGFLRDFPDDAVILRRELFPQDNLWNYAKLTRRKLNIQEPEAYLKTRLPAGAKGVVQRNLAGEKAYALGYSFDGEGLWGALYLARIEDFSFDVTAAKLTHLGVKDLLVYDYASRKTQAVAFPPGKFMEFAGFLDRTTPMPQSLGAFNPELFWVKPKK